MGNGSRNTLQQKAHHPPGIHNGNLTVTLTISPCAVGVVTVTEGSLWPPLVMVFVFPSQEACFCRVPPSLGQRG